MTTNETRKGRVTFETPEPSPLSAVTLPLGLLCSHVWATLPLFMKGGSGPTRHVSLPAHPNIESPIVLDDSDASQDATGVCIRNAAEGFGGISAAPISIGLLRSNILKASVTAQRSNISAYIASLEEERSSRNTPTVIDESTDFLVNLDSRDKEKLWVHIYGCLPVNEVLEGKGRQQRAEVPTILPALEVQLGVLMAKSTQGYNDQQLTLLALATNIVSLSATRNSALAAVERILYFIAEELKGGSPSEGFLQRVVIPMLHLIPLIGTGCDAVLVEIASHLRDVSASPLILKGASVSLQVAHFVEKVRVDSTNGGRWQSTIKFPYAKRLVVNVERCDAPKYFACGHVGTDGFTSLPLSPSTQQSFPAGTLLFKHRCDNWSHGMGTPTASRGDDDNSSLGGSPVMREVSDWGSTLFDTPDSNVAPPAPPQEHALIVTIKAEVELEVDADWQRELRHAVIDAFVAVSGHLLQSRQLVDSAPISPLYRGGLGNSPGDFSVGGAILSTPDDVFSMKARCRRSEVPSKKPALAIAAHHLVTGVSNVDDLWRSPLWRDLVNRAAIRPAVSLEGVVNPEFSPTQVAEYVCCTTLPLALHPQSIHTTAQVIEWSERLLSSQAPPCTIDALLTKRAAMYERCRTGLSLLHAALDMSDIPPTSLDNLITVLRDFLNSKSRSDRHYLCVVHGCGAQKEDDIRQMVMEALRKLFTLNRMQRRQADTVSSHRYLRTELRHGTTMLGMVSLLSTPLDQWDLTGLCKPYGRQKFTLVRELAEMLPKFGEFARSQSFSLSSPTEEVATQSLLEGLVNIWANPESARGTRNSRGETTHEKIEVSFEGKLFHHYPMPFVQASRVFGYAEITIKADAPMIIALLPPQAMVAYAEGKSVGSFADANMNKYHFYDVSGKVSSPGATFSVPPLFATDVLGVAYSIEGTSPVLHYYLNSLRVLTVPLHPEATTDMLYISVLSQRQCRCRATIRFSGPFRKNDPTELNPCSRHRPTQHLVSAFALTVMHIIMDRAARFNIHDFKHSQNSQVADALSIVLSLGEGVVSESIEGICDAATALLEESPPEATERVKVHTAITVYDRMLYSLLCIAKVVVAGVSLGRQGSTNPPVRLLRAVAHLVQQKSGLKFLVSCEAAAHILSASIRNGIVGPVGAPVGGLSVQQHSSILRAVANSLVMEDFRPQFDVAGTHLQLSSHGLRVGSAEGGGAAITTERIRLSPNETTQHTFSILFQRNRQAGPSLGVRTLLGVCRSAVIEDHEARRSYWKTIVSNPEECYVLPVSSRVEQQSLIPGIKCSTFNFPEAFQHTSSWISENETVYGPDDIVSVCISSEGGTASISFSRNGVSLGSLYTFSVTEPVELTPIVGLSDKDVTAVIVSPLVVDRHDHRMTMFIRELAATSPMEICKLEPVLQRALLRSLGSDGDPTRLTLQTIKERRQAPTFGAHLGGRLPPELLQHLVGVMGGLGGLGRVETVNAPSTKPCTLLQFNDSSNTALVTTGKGSGPVRQQLVDVSQLRCNAGSSLFIDSEVSSEGVASLVRFVCSRIFSDERGRVSIEEAGQVARSLRVLRGLLYVGQTLSTTNVPSDRSETSIFEACTTDELRDLYEVLQLLGSVLFATPKQSWTPREREDALLTTNWADIGTTVAFAWCVVDALPRIISYDCSPNVPCFDFPRQAVRIQTPSEIKRENMSLLNEMTTYEPTSDERTDEADATLAPRQSLNSLLCHQCGGSPWEACDHCSHDVPVSTLDVLNGVRTRSGAASLLGVLQEVWCKQGYDLTFSSTSTLEAVSGVGNDTRGTFDFIGSFCDGWVLSLRTQYRHIDCSAEGAAEVAEEDEQWSCDVCTFLNDNTSARCGMCSTSRPGASWNCGECTYAYNSTAATRCEMCGTSRPGAQSADPTSEYSAACSVCMTSVPYARFADFTAVRHCDVCGIATTYLPTVPVKGSIDGTMQISGDIVLCKWVADTTYAITEDVRLERKSGLVSVLATEEECSNMCRFLPPLPPASTIAPRSRSAFECSSLAQSLSFFSASILPFVVSAIPEGESLHAEDGAPTQTDAKSVAQVIASFTCADPFWTNLLADAIPEANKGALLRACLDVLPDTPSVVLSRLAASLVKSIPTSLNLTLYALAHIALSSTSETRRAAIVDTLAKTLDTSPVVPNLTILSKLLLLKPRSQGVQRLMVLVATRGGKVPFETAAPACLALALICEAAMSQCEPLPSVVDAPVTSLTHRLIPMANTTMMDESGLVSGQVRGSTAADPRKGGKYYYEVVVPPDNLQRTIHMGWGTREHEQQSSFHHVGADNHSVAFDLGRILHVMGGGQEYHPPRRIKGGDVVGALLDVDINQMCWSLNGEEIGMWMMVPLPTVEPLFPFVSARVDDGKVEVKLGSTQFCPEGFTDFTVQVSGKTFVDRSLVPAEPLPFYEQLCHWANDLCALGIRLEDLKGGDTEWEGRGRTQLALYSLVQEKVRGANGSLSVLRPYLQHLDSISSLALSAASLESAVRNLDNCAASCVKVKKLLLFAARWGVIERVLVSAIDRDARACAVTVDMALARQAHTETISILQNSIAGQLFAATNDENIFKRRNMLTIKLNGSISEDGGGILRTVLSLLSEEMMFTFNPNTSEREPPKLPLFKCNDHSSIFNVLPNTDALHGPHADLCQSMLRWVGKVMGNAALTGRLMLAVSFPKILWMKLVNDTPSIEDLFYDCNDTCKKSLEDPDLLLSDLYFDVFPSVDERSLLQVRGEDEKTPSSPLTGPPGGMFVMPSSDDLALIGQSRTKNQQKMINRRREAATNALLTEYDEAIGFMKEGMEAVVPPAALAEMHWDDLRRRVTGSSTQTPADLLREMDMEGLSDTVRIMLTEAVESLPADLCSRLLLFCTGQSRLPLPEKIKVVELDEPSKVPSSHTCSPITLTIHNYASTEEMHSKLLTAISNAYEFGFV